MKRQTKWAGILLVLGMFTFILHGLGSRALPLIDRDEPYFAEVSREMIESRDFIVPHFNHKPWLHKPPLVYWLQVLSFRIFGENNGAARLPSILAAMMTVLVLFGMGSRLYDRETGLYAAIAFCLSLQTFIQAKAATMDMVLVLFMTLTAWAGWELLRDADTTRRFYRKRFWWIFYTALSLGFLAKGPAAFLPLAGIFLYARGARVTDFSKKMRFMPGLFWTSLLIGLWAVPALILTRGEFWTVGMGKHVLYRSVSAMEGHGGGNFPQYLWTLPYYFLTSLASFLPWTWLVPAAVISLKKSRFSNPSDRYLGCGICVIFLVFTVVSTKLPHYILPAMPLLSLLVIRQCRSRGYFKKIFSCFAAAMVLAAFAANLFLVPAVAKQSPAGRLYAQSSDWLTPDMEFASYGFNEPSLVWEFRKSVRGWHRFYEPDDMPEALRNFMEQQGPRFCVLPAEDVSRVFPEIPDSWKRTEAEGWNFAKGGRVRLAMLIKENQRTESETPRSGAVGV